MRYFLSTKLVPKYNGYYANFQHKKQQNTDAKYCDIRSYIKIRPFSVRLNAIFMICNAPEFKYVNSYHIFKITL